jgi:hypothetical protein
VVPLSCRTVIQAAPNPPRPVGVIHVWCQR